jgi:hypothetical protein
VEPIDLRRRAFLASLASTGVLAACSPLASHAPIPGVAENLEHAHRRRGTSAPPTLGTALLNFANASGYPNSDVYYAVWGQDYTSAAQWWYLKNGTLSLTQQGSGTSMFTQYQIGQTITLPLLQSGEIWISIGKPLEINVVSNGVAPATPVIFVSPPSSDPNYYTLFNQIEFTYAQTGAFLNVDTTAVDIVGLPLQFMLTGKGGTQGPYGLIKGTLPRLFADMASHPCFDQLLVKEGSNVIRAIAPNHGISLGLFPADYLDGYIDLCWNYLAQTGNAMTVSYPAGTPCGGWVAGTAVGSVKNGLLRFKPGKGSSFTAFSIPQPTTYDAIGCTGVFVPSTCGGNSVAGSILAVVAAGINRTSLISSATQPQCDSSTYYRNPQTNFYSKAIHDFSVQGKGYGFAFDDDCGNSTDIQVDVPTGLTITVLPA